MSNYTQGRNFEYHTMKVWRDRGYNVSRSAGSHSPVDVFAWQPNRPLKLVQCKKVRSHATAQRLITKFKAETMPSCTWHSVLTIKVKGTKLPIEVTISFTG